MKVLLVDTKKHILDTLKPIFDTNTDEVFHIIDLSLLQDLLRQTKFDVVITASLLDKISGDQLLKSLSHSYPSMIRVQVINDENFKKNNAHFNFTQPLNLKDITLALNQSQNNSKAITKNMIVKAVANVKILPSPPKVYMQLTNALKENDTDSQKISGIILQDPGLTAKVLQFANSSLMPKGKTVTSISDAITKMGAETLSCIVMTAELFMYEPNIPNFSLEKEQLHSFATAKLAASIVKPELKQQAMIAGLLHGIGKVVLYEIKPQLNESFFKHYNPKEDNCAIEQKIYGTDHCHIGAYLLHTWSLSYSTIEAVLLHLSPKKLLKSSFGVVQAVYLANALLKEYELDQDFIKHFKMEGVLDELEQRANRLR